MEGPAHSLTKLPNAAGLIRPATCPQPSRAQPPVVLSDVHVLAKRERMAVVEGS